MAVRPTTPTVTPAQAAAQAAHPLNRPQTAPPATPQPPRPAAPIKIAKIVKITVASFLILMVIGLFASLSHHSNEIADLKAKIHSTSAQDDIKLKNAKLDYTIKYCNQVAAKGDGPECIQETLDSLH